MNSSLIYNIELNDDSPRSEQPSKITIPLKPHQLASLFKASIMENTGTINYNLNNQSDIINLTSRHNTVSINYNLNNTVSELTVNVSTNIGILGDIVGYGKTLTALGIIANNKLEDIHVNENCIKSYNNTNGNSYFNVSYKNHLIEPLKNNMINSTLVIVPRGPVYVQWEETIKKYSKLNCLFIDNLAYIKKNLPIFTGTNHKEIHDYFNKYDMVLIKNTTLKIFIDYYMINNNYNIIKNWKRIMIDEAHDFINKLPIFKYYYLWLISGTYPEISRRMYNNSSYYLTNLIKDFMTDEFINLMLIKNNHNFVKNSFRIPAPIEKIYLCKLSNNISAIKNFINSSMLEKINANDIAGVIKDLGGKNETEDDIVELVCRELNRELLNKECEQNYINSLNIPIENKNLRLKNIAKEIENQKEKIKNLSDRITELSVKSCPICMDFLISPIILECTHIYCGQCLFNWLNTKNISTCPTCRSNISPSKMIAIVDTKNNDEIKEPEFLSKEDTFIKIIKEKPNGKFLVFSKIDNGFDKIKMKMNDNNIKFELLKGTTSHMMNILNKFKIGEINIILLNTQYAGSGIDINFATDVIIFHSMGLDKQQAVGRAQRVGRNDQLFIHNLCYEHEMNDIKG